jgi:hypothetical protein
MEEQETTLEKFLEDRKRYIEKMKKLEEIESLDELERLEEAEVERGLDNGETLEQLLEYLEKYSKKRNELKEREKQKRIRKIEEAINEDEEEDVKEFELDDEKALKEFNRYREKCRIKRKEQQLEEQIQQIGTRGAFVDDFQALNEVLGYDMPVSMRLEEYYRKPDLNWIRNFVNELYSKQTRSAKQVHSIAKKYNVVIRRGPEESKGPRWGLKVIKGLYDLDTKQYVITLTVNALIDIVDIKEDKKELFEELCYVFSHEDIHKQQDQLNRRNQKYIKFNKNTDEEIEQEIKKVIEKTGKTEKEARKEVEEKEEKRFIRHISQDVEIDANASSMAYDFQKNIGRKNKNIEDLMDKIVANDFYPEDISDTTLKLYLAYRYKTNTKIWQHFLVQLYKSLKQYKSEGGLADYRDWMVKHGNKY